MNPDVPLNQAHSPLMPEAPMARKVRLSETTYWNKVHKWQAAGIIAPFVERINPRKQFSYMFLLGRILDIDHICIWARQLSIF